MAQGYGYRSEQRLRKENQDTHGVFEFEGFTVLVVCDGMGGHVGGRQASSIAVRTIHDELQGFSGGDVRSALRRSVEAANRAIYEMARKNYRLMGMGTTCVAAIVQGNTAHVAHVGDSRCYLVRDGQIRAVTRDHTMVNLFVDAELLSPEDAATHPEAHVLSRSLGVERQVEVDLSEPITLQTADRLLVCSDGVHGVIGTSGLGSVDWRNPQEGVDAALDAIERAKGDDNATLVAYGLAISGTSAPVTFPPDLAGLEEEARQAPVQVSLQPVRRPTIVPGAGQPDGDDTIPMIEDVDAEPLDPSDQAIPRGAAAQAAAQRSRTRLNWKVLAPLAAVLFLVVAGISFAALRMVGGGAGTEVPATVVAASDLPSRPAAPTEPVPMDDPPAEDGSAMAGDQVAPEVYQGGETEEVLLASSGSGGMFRTRCLDCTASFGLPTAAAYLSGKDDPEVAVAFFDPEIPPAPRRVPNSTSVYDHPPPSGPDQTKAVRAARNKRCREALDTVRYAILKSIDYASLYGAAWFCFNDSHVNELARARSATWEDFRPLLVHFEGERRVPAAVLRMLTPPEPAPAEATADASGEEGTEDAEGTDVASTTGENTTTPAPAPVADLPDIWQLPATGGIEYRLALFEIDGDVQGFRDIMLDLLGEETVADHLAADILLEATAAASVARMVDPSPEALQVWARRVYVASRAMTGPIGELIRAHRPEVAGLIEALLFEATGGDDGLLAIEEGFQNDAVPPVVARAQAAGLIGQMPDLSDLDALVNGELTQEERAQLGNEGSDAMAVADEGDRGGRRSGSSRGYDRRRRQDPSVSRRRTPSVSDEDFRMIVYYPRQRVRVLLPTFQQGESGYETTNSQGFDDISVFRKLERDPMELDDDWVEPPDGE